VVADRVLHDPLEEKRQFLDRALRIFLRELHHRVLHDVEGRLLLLHRVNALLERAALH
jgi:hypothetical protein